MMFNLCMFKSTGDDICASNLHYLQKKSHSEEKQFYLNWSLGMTDSIYLFSKTRETIKHSILT